MSITISVVAKSYGYLNLTSQNENPVGSIRRWSHDICDSTGGHSSNRVHPSDVGKGNECLFEQMKIQNHGGLFLGIPCYPEITTLDFRLTSTAGRSGNITLSRVSEKLKALARDVYGTNLCLNQRIMYEHIFSISKIWHSAHIFRASREHVRQVLTSIFWYILSCAIFRVP